MSVTTLIVAAGRGTRAAGTNTIVPKQYLPVGGVPMLTRTIGAFASHPSIDDIIVVIHPDDIGLYESAAVHFAARLRPPVPGGERRQDSVRYGLEPLSPGPRRVSSSTPGRGPSSTPISSVASCRASTLMTARFLAFPSPIL